MRTMRLTFFTTAFAVIFSLIAVLVARAQTSVEAITITDANLRAGPGRNYSSITSLATGIPVFVYGRDVGTDWLFVQTLLGKQGWLMTKQVQLKTLIDLKNLAVRDNILPPLSENVTIPPAEGATVTTSSGNVPIGYPTIYAAQITPAIRQSMKAVFAKGRTLGNNPRMFSKVGDCHSGHVWFLNQFGGGHQYNLGPYTYLQGVIAHFSVPAHPGESDSFVMVSQAARSGFTSAGVLDYLWADPKFCQNGESPLLCEYRINNPSVAIIQFGILDPGSLSVEQYEAAMNQIIFQTLSLGIIPILSTAPENPVFPDKAKQFNRIVIDLAHRKNIPLINLAAALKILPNNGLDPDRLHLSPASHFGGVEFIGESMNTGLTIWNLLALQSLDNVWRQIMN